MRQLQHVDVAHAYRLFELIAGHAVVQRSLARRWQSCMLEQRLDLAFLSAVEHGRTHEDTAGKRWSQRFQLFVPHLANGVSELGVFEQSLQFAADRFRAGVFLEHPANLLAQGKSRPAQMRFENLAHIHTAGYAKRIQNDLDRRSVFEVRHVLFRQNARDHALVSVTSRHLVANAQLALHGDVDLDQLDHARWQLVALGELFFLLVDDLLQHVDLARGHFLDLVDLLIHSRILVCIFNTLQVASGDALDRIAIKNVPLVQQALVGALVVQVGLHFLAAENVLQTLEPLVRKNADFVGKVFLQLADLRAFDELGALVLFLALTGEDFYIDDNALNPRRAVERSIAHVAGLFAED